MTNFTSLFSLDPAVTYLNCAYMSPQLKAVEKAGQKALIKKNNPWQYTGDDFFNTSDNVRALFARLLSANADDIALIPSVSYGIATVAKNTPLAAGENIVCLDQQFPSNVYSWLRLAEESRASVRFATRKPSETWLAAVLDCIDSQTRIIAVPNVHWSDGRIVDIGAIAKAIAGRNITLVLDLTQSIGARPFSVENCPADYIISAAYKWLLGPYGLAFMYVHPRHQSGVPIEENWINRKDSKNFANLVNYEENYERGARRFDSGERSHFQLMPMAEAALEGVHTLTPQAITAHTKELTDYLAENVQHLNVETIESSERAAHITGVTFPHEVPKPILDKLANERVSISVRGNSIRVSPHVYNTIEDMDRFIGCLS